ncbi:MAG: hypothetical protein P1P84_25750, partial [Deferrisomatales bacterium]|nr:hypothetical protein [Deferrisomatales bacterium]
MLRPVFFWLSCAALCSLSTPALAQQVGTKVAVTYATLGMSASDGPIVDVGSDATNRVWAVNAGRVSAALGSVRAPLLPITVADTPLAAAARFRSVSFAVPAGNTGDGEHFYLGSSAGIAWGRLASKIEQKSPLLVAPPTGGPWPADADPNFVNDTANDGGDWLWSATRRGLVLWDLGLSDPNSTSPARYLDDYPTSATHDGWIDRVAVTPWGDAAAADGDLLWLVDVDGNETLVRELGSGVFAGITFDAAGNLWAATTSTVSSVPQLLKFEADGALGTPPTGLTGGVKNFPLNPFVGSGVPAGFLPTDIAVDGLTGRVWVTTSSSNQGAMKTAYFQDPADASGDLNDDPGGNNWEVVSRDFDSHTVVHTDTAGNAWFGMAGSSEALNGYVVRLLTLDKSRYLGGATGVATLFDLSLAGSGSALISIAVASDNREFSPAETPAGSGTFVQTFRIVPSGEAGGSGEEFLASSSATDVPVKASYTFTD